MNNFGNVKMCKYTNEERCYDSRIDDSETESTRVRRNQSLIAERKLST